MRLLQLQPVIFFASREEANQCDLEFDSVETGIGRVNASLKTHQYLSNYSFGRVAKKVPLIINVGTCGSAIQIPEGSLVMPSDAISFDFSGKSFERTKIGTNDQTLSFFKRDITSFVDEDLHTFDATSIGKPNTLFTSDVFVNKDNFRAKTLARINRTASFYDMEASAIAKVCEQFHVPFISIKIISDFGDIDCDGWEERANKLKDKLTRAANSYATLIQCYFNDF